MQYMEEILWYASWPLLIIVSVKFVQLNLRKFQKKANTEKATRGE